MNRHGNLKQTFSVVPSVIVAHFAVREQYKNVI